MKTRRRRRIILESPPKGSAREKLESEFKRRMETRPEFIHDRFFVGQMTLTELLEQDKHLNLEQRFASYYSMTCPLTIGWGIRFVNLEPCGKICKWKLNPPNYPTDFDRSEALVYRALLKNYMREVCEMTLLCLWKACGIPKDVVLMICRNLWRMRKFWMP